MTAGENAKKGTGLRSAVVGGAIGNFIEWYDWAIYGFLSGIFAHQIFPSSDPTTSIMAAYGTFAAGFLMRPVGALVLSPLADRYGRRDLLSLTIILAGIGSLMIALTPTYASIGIAAPIIVLCARLLQGFSAGGEYQIAATFINEHAPKSGRALAGSSQMVSAGLSALFAAGVASLTTKLIPDPELSAWGWRIPFFLGALLSLYALYLRTNLPETTAFKKIDRAQKKFRAGFLSGLREFPRETFIVFVIEASSVQFYIWIIFLPTYAYLSSGMPLAQGLLGGMVALAVYCASMPLFAKWSDRIGRKPFLIGSAAGFLFLAYPMLQALENANFTTFLIVNIVGVILIALNNAVLGTVLCELFPTRLRASAIGFPHAICGALFGGTAPIIATYLLSRDMGYLIAIYIMVITLISILVHVVMTPETYSRSLD